MKKQKEVLEQQNKELKVDKLNLEESLKTATDEINQSKMQLKETATKLTTAEQEIIKLRKDLER